MTWDEFFLRQVYLVASKSKDRSTKIGAVLVRGNRVVAQGYNGLPTGIDDDVEERQVRPEKYLWTEHAERNAIYSCARHGVASLGATMYTQGIPCADCARAIIQGGVAKVVVHKQWMRGGGFVDRWAESCRRSEQMFAEAGVTLEAVAMDLGVDGFVDGERLLV